MSEQDAAVPVQQIFNLSGKAALVTGGALGIGAGIARRLAEAGAQVMISDINEAAARKTADAITQAGWTARAVQADSSRLEDIQRVTDETVAQFGGLDILVNNAGIFPPRPVLEVDAAFWERVIDLNLNGAFFHAQAAAKVMVERGTRGRIINIASIDALRPTANYTHYDTSKGGLVMMTKTMALELGQYGITVNAVAPGFIATEGSTGGLGGEELPPEQLKEILAPTVARIALGRAGVPDDIALPVLFLASPAANYITGELLVVDGGFLLA